MTIRSALYVGHVVHQRFTPKQHSLRHRVYWLLLDLEELAQPGFTDEFRLFSHNRTNLVSFHDKDHGDGSDRPLIDQALSHLRSAEIDVAGLSIKLLCMPRVAGYDFNPISTYFCCDPAGRLVAMIYEVNNTYGGRHSYVIPVTEVSKPGPRPIQQTCAKELYVSPFMDLDMTYRFRTKPPGDNVALTIQAGQEDRVIIHTSLTGAKCDLNDRNLFRLALTHPVLPMKVTAAIHWHALKLWMRGFKVNPASPSKARNVTIVRPPE